MRFKNFYLEEMASLNSLSDENDGDEVFNDIVTKNHIGYSEPIEKFKFDNILWARYGKNLFAGFDNSLIRPENVMIVTLVDFRNKWNLPLVYGIETKEKYRNKGRATKIHEYFIKKYGGFITDDSLSFSPTNGGIYFVYKKFIEKYPSYEISPRKKILKKIKNIPNAKDMYDMDNMNMFLVSKDELDEKEWNQIKESVIFEMPEIHDRYGSTAKHLQYTKPEIGRFYTKYKESKLMKKIENIEIRRLDYITDETYLYYVVDGKPVAVLVYKFLDKKAKDFNKYPMVGWMYTTPDHLKKGIQQELHNFLMAYHTGILIDTTLSPEGFKFYKKFSEPFFTYSFDNDDTYSKIKQVDWNKVKNNRHERFVVLKNRMEE